MTVVTRSDVHTIYSRKRTRHDKEHNRRTVGQAGRQTGMDGLNKGLVLVRQWIDGGGKGIGHLIIINGN